MRPPPSRLPGHEARRLWAVALAWPLPESTFRELEVKRLAGEPLQYLEGTAAFGPLELVVDHRVLIPRPETEQLWELARGLVEHPSVIVDLCTGSGALAFGLATSHPDARVLATELSLDAVDVARFNADRLGLAVEVLAGDLYDPLPSELRGAVDLLVANPPYVSEVEWEELPTDVRKEPSMALVAGPTGTEVFDRIVGQVGEWLAPGGWFVCEIGETQGGHCRDRVAAVLEHSDVRRDLAGRDRFVIGRRAG